MTTAPAKLTPHRRVIPDTEERLAVWVSWRLSGTKSTAALFGCSRRTVYRIAAEVDESPALAARAHALLEAARSGARARAAGRAAEVVLAALDKIAAELARPTASAVLALKAIDRLAPLCGVADAGGVKAALELPSVLTTPRDE
jgi:hypothetical protein